MNELKIGDKIFLSSRRTAHVLGYTNDYIGKLCREGKLEAKLVERTWYVSKDAIDAYTEEIKNKKEKNKRELTARRLEEYRKSLEKTNKPDLKTEGSLDAADTAIVPVFIPGKDRSYFLKVSLSSIATFIIFFALTSQATKIAGPLSNVSASVKKVAGVSVTELKNFSDSVTSKFKNLETESDRYIRNLASSEKRLEENKITSKTEISLFAKGAEKIKNGKNISREWYATTQDSFLSVKDFYKTTSQKNIDSIKNALTGYSLALEASAEKTKTAVFAKVKTSTEASISKFENTKNSILSEKEKAKQLASYARGLVINGFAKTGALALGGFGKIEQGVVSGEEKIGQIILHGEKVVAQGFTNMSAATTDGFRNAGRDIISNKEKVQQLALRGGEFSLRGLNKLHIAIINGFERLGGGLTSGGEIALNALKNTGRLGTAGIKSAKNATLFALGKTEAGIVAIQGKMLEASKDMSEGALVTANGIAAASLSEFNKAKEEIGTVRGKTVRTIQNKTNAGVGIVRSAGEAIYSSSNKLAYSIIGIKHAAESKIASLVEKRTDQQLAQISKEKDIFEETPYKDNSKALSLVASAGSHFNKLKATASESFASFFAFRTKSENREVSGIEILKESKQNNFKGNNLAVETKPKFALTAGVGSLWNTVIDLTSDALVFLFDIPTQLAALPAPSFMPIVTTPPSIGTGMSSVTNRIILSQGITRSELEAAIQSLRIEDVILRNDLLGYISRSESRQARRLAGSFTSRSSGGGGNVDISTIDGSIITNSSFEGSVVASALTLGAINGPLHANAGVVSATTSVGTIYGGTGLTAYTTGDILYASGENTLSRLAIGSNDQVLKISGGVPTWGLDMSVGGGAGAWATSTSNLFIYPADPADVVVVGGSATTTTGNIFEVIGSGYFSGNLSIATSSPSQKLAVQGNGLFSGDVKLANLTATGTITNLGTATSTFAGGLSTVGLASSAGLTITGGSLKSSGLLEITNSGTSTFSGGITAAGLSSSNGLTLTGGSLVSSGNLNITSTATSTLAGGLSGTSLALSQGLTLTGGSILSTSAATSTFSGGLFAAGLASNAGLTITGGGIKSSGNLEITSSATSTFSAGLSLTNLNSSTGITITGGSLLNTSSATSTFAGGLSLGSLASSGGLTITGGSLKSSGLLEITNTGTSTFSGAVAATELSSSRSAYFATSGGNVGIGTTTPMSKLAVVGGNITQTASGNPTLLATDTTMTGARGGIAVGKYLYGIDSNLGLRIYDITNPSTPKIISTLSFGSFQFNYLPFVAGNHLYLTGLAGAFRIVDISNPFAPVQKSVMSLGGTSTGVFVSGKYAYVGAGTPGLKIIDISNPSAPVVVGTYNTSGAAALVSVVGKYAYVTDGNSGLQIIDVSIPSAPILVGTLDTSGSALGLYVSGKYAYIGDSGNGLLIVDISNPASPTLVSTFSTTVGQLTMAGKYVYLTAGAQGIKVIDVSNASNPFLVGTYASAASPDLVSVTGKYLFYGDFGGAGTGISILDLNGAEVPTFLAGTIDTNILNVAENINAYGSLNLAGGLNAGMLGIYSQGGIHAFVASTTATELISGTFMGGNVGIGTTTPAALLSVQGNGLFSGDVKLANLTATGTITNLGTGTSTFSGGIATAGLSTSAGLTITGGSILNTSTATSTFAGGFNVTSGCFAINGTCVSGSGGGGVSTYLALTDAPDTFTASAIPYTNAGATALLHNSNFVFTGTNLGVGTSSPSTTLAVEGNAQIMGSLTVANSITTGSLTATGTITNLGTATSTFAGGLSTVGLASSAGLTITGGSLKSSGLLEITNSGTSTFSGGITAAGLSSSNGLTLTGGSLVSSGNLNITSTATSTLAGGLSGTSLALSQGLTLTGGSILSTSAATSTFANGFNITSGCFAVAGTCISASSGGSGTPGGSDSQIQYNNGGLFGGATGFTFDDITFNVGIGTTTPGTKLSVQGDAQIMGSLNAANSITTGSLVATGTVTSLSTATSTFSGGLSLNSLNSSSGLTITGGSILNTSTATSSFSGGVATAGLSTSAGLILSGGSILSTSNATSTLANGFDITSGCYAINGTCLSVSGGGGGSGTVNTGVANYFAYYSASNTTVDDQTVLNIVSGNIGLGTTTPGKLLSVNNDAVITGNLDVAGIFATSTINTLGTATSTWLGGLSLTNLNASTGIKITGGTLLNTSTATSTFSGGIATAGLSSSSGLTITGGSILNTSTATSTFAGGFNITSGCFAINGICLSTSGGGSSQWTTTGNDIYYTTGNVGIGTTSPYAKLSVVGEVVSTIYTATSTTATSTFAGGFDVGDGALSYNWSTGVTSISGLNIGSLNFDTDAGIVSWADLPISSAANGIVQSYTAQIGSNPVLTIYGESNGSAGAKNLRVGIGTTSPFAALAVAGTTTLATSNAFLVSDAASTTRFVIQDAGNIGIGTTSPWALLSIDNRTGLSNPAFFVGSTTAVNLIVAQSGNVGIGTTSPWRKFDVNGTVGFKGLTNDGSGNYLCVSANNEVTYSGTACVGASSARFKHDIVSLGGALEQVNRLRAVSFIYNSDVAPNDSSTHLGFIAEEVDLINPNLVAYDSLGLPKSVKYDEFTPLLAKAIQEQQLQIGSLVSSTAELDLRSSTLSSGIANSASDFETLTSNLASTTQTTASLASALDATNNNLTTLGTRMDELFGTVSLLTEQTAFQISGQLSALTASTTFVGILASSTAGILASTTEDVLVHSNSFLKNIFNAFTEFLASTVTRIKGVFVSELHIEDKLCADDICINKDQLKALLISAGGVSTSTAPVETPEIETEDEDTESPTPSPAVEFTATSSPETISSSDPEESSSESEQNKEVTPSPSVTPSSSPEPAVVESEPEASSVDTEIETEQPEEPTVDTSTEPGDGE